MSLDHWMTSKQMIFLISVAYFLEILRRSRTVSFAGSQEPSEPTTSKYAGLPAAQKDSRMGWYFWILELRAATNDS
ncbi:hypothetical protein TNCT_462501 [Trichonephila clavata]|uniref:Uncharacterized protein n=1 Tax=Trichonephila clavata TaxID=2740835 RepID=A0A8X6HNX9_TRICU|nr:hypothetical protein TNCT_462501 [Trichonephila clavata]